MNHFRPNFIALPLIAQCNYRCNFCEINGVDVKLKQGGKAYQRNVMTVENIDAFRSMIRSADVINLGGRTGIGEPLLAPNFDDIVRKIRSINTKITIDLSTNGFLLDKDRAELLASCAPIAVTFSIHAASPEVYATVMGPGRPDRFERVVQNIRYFNQVRQGKPSRTNINFGIGRLNYMDAVAAVTMAKDLGVDAMTVYFYYKSPNSFEEDVSLYNDIPLANATLQAVYDEAKRVGMYLEPQEPKFMVSEAQASGITPLADLVNGKVETVQQPAKQHKPYVGGCPEPYSSLLLKSDPTRKGKAAIALCNRISAMEADIERLTEADLFWAWHHPVFNSMRLPNPLDVPPICQMCKDPCIGSLRSLDNEGYKKRRDKAVEDTLRPFQTPELVSSPTGAIRLLDRNIYSIDAPDDEE